MQHGPYYLWLKPAEPVYGNLVELIGKLSRQHGTPIFDPHITLLGPLRGSVEQLTACLRQFVSKRTPLNARCVDVGMTEEYFRCLFLSVENDSALTALREDIKMSVPNEDTRRFQPHISLIYGDLPTGKKATLAAELHSWASMEFRLNSVSLYSAAGEPADWQQLDDFYFAGKQ